jgi:hypothetical protein
MLCLRRSLRFFWLFLLLTAKPVYAGEAVDIESKYLKSVSFIRNNEIINWNVAKGKELVIYTAPDRCRIIAFAQAPNSMIYAVALNNQYKGDSSRTDLIIFNYLDKTSKIIFQSSDAII